MYNDCHFEIRDKGIKVIDIIIKNNKLFYNVVNKNSVVYDMLGNNPNIQRIVKYIEGRYPRVNNKFLENIDLISDIEKVTDNIIIHVIKE